MSLKVTLGWIVGLSMVGIILVSMSLTLAPFSTVQGRVVSENSWAGGDLTRYYNVTVSYQGHDFTGIIRCDYYQLNSSLPLNFNYWGQYLGFDGQYGGMPIGC